MHRVPGPTSPGDRGPRPHSAVQNGAIYTTNWSGQILSGDTYTGVGGQWTVPPVQPSAAAEYSATWIGIDGTTAASTLIQTGTSQDTVSGTTTYSAWVELLPSPAMTINAPVAAGDAIQAAVFQTSTDVWTIQIQDTTANWTFSSPFSYSTPGLSAEWIEEPPTVNGGQSVLADFGNVTFANMGALAASNSSVLTPAYLLDPTASVIIAYPGAFDSTTNSFTDFFGTPPPVVTSVNPAEGITAGGSFVTIQGQFFLGARSVTFGSTPAFFSVGSDGSITAVSPAGSGTIDVVVTTPGGSSAISGGDHYTYLAPAPPPPPPPPPAPDLHGYWLVGGDGGIFTFGSAGFYGSTGNLRLQRPVVGITPTVDRTGYWLVASDGGIFAFGDAGFYGSIPGLGYSPAGTVGARHRLNAPVVGMVPSIDGGGYFMVAADGGVFAFGDARFAGSCPGIGGCAGPAVAVMPDASGNGYWVVTANGDVYSFGDAVYYGGPGSRGSVVTSATRTPDGQGYWILFADGTVAGFGDAADFGGPTGAARGSDPAAAIFTTADGEGYWVTSAAGAVYTYGDAPYEGGMGGVRLNAPVIAATGW